jgi:DNA-binding MarR family transcriptional regulator
MDKTTQDRSLARLELANRLFFRLYQCANMLHKTGTRAVETEGLTTQQWAVMGALSRDSVRKSNGGGMAVGDLARYLMVSRQNLAGLVQRMVRDGHIEVVADELSRRNKVVRLTRAGDKTWSKEAQPKIRKYYESALADFSIGDISHSLHYLMKLLENMKSLDTPEHRRIAPAPIRNAAHKKRQRPA